MSNVYFDYSFTHKFLPPVNEGIVQELISEYGYTLHRIAEILKTNFSDIKRCFEKLFIGPEAEIKNLTNSHDKAFRFIPYETTREEGKSGIQSYVLNVNAAEYLTARYQSPISYEFIKYLILFKYEVTHLHNRKIEELNYLDDPILQHANMIKDLRLKELKDSGSIGNIQTYLENVGVKLEQALKVLNSDEVLEAKDKDEPLKLEEKPVETKREYIRNNKKESKIEWKSNNDSDINTLITKLKNVPEHYCVHKGKYYVTLLGFIKVDNEKLYDKIKLKTEMDDILLRRTLGRRLSGAAKPNEMYPSYVSSSNMYELTFMKAWLNKYYNQLVYGEE